MIVSLCGVLERKEPEGLVITLGGVSLLVRAPLPVVERSGNIGETVKLYTSLQVREDSLTLYGFDTEQTRRLFELLLTVNGVGPRLALSLLSTLSLEALVAAIASGDTTTLARAPGVGRRTAERLAVELRDRLEREWGPAPVPTAASASDGDVMAALVALGYSATEARQAAALLPPGELLPLEEKVRRILQHLGRR